MCLMQVTQVDLHRLFHSLNAGVIEDVRTQRDKGFGFVRYSTHAEAALAIQMGNGQIICGKPIKVKSHLLPTCIIGIIVLFFSQHNKLHSELARQ
jgi:nucleolysin TIA-1/TIAR